jgi:hypothetical protein
MRRRRLMETGVKSSSGRHSQKGRRKKSSGGNGGNGGDVSFVIPPGSKALGFRWEKGFQRAADPEKVGRELLRIQKRDGFVMPSAMVEAAKNPRSEMHPMLWRWSDPEAARLYREEQARSILRTIRWVYESKEGEEIERRIFVHVTKEYTQEDEGGYVIIEQVPEISAEDYVRDRAEDGLVAWCERYAELSERIPAAFEMVLEAITIIRRHRKKKG